MGECEKRGRYFYWEDVKSHCCPVDKEATVRQPDGKLIEKTIGFRT